MMELDDLSFLLSDQGQQILAELASDPILPEDHLRVAERLRQKVEPARVHGLLETALLRQMATGKFSRAGEMYFTRPALEQSSAEIISFLAGSLATAASAPPAAPRAPAPPWWQRMIDRLRRPRAAVVTMPEPEPIVRWRGESAG